MDTEANFQALFWGLLGAIMVMRAWFAYRVRKAGERLLPDAGAIRREGAGLFALRVLLFVALLGFLASYALGMGWVKALSFPLPAWLRWIGFGLGLASLFLWAGSQAALDAHWSAQLQLRTRHQLVTVGPYARMRHPLYSAMLGISLAFALVTANWAFVVFGLASVAGVVLRAPREEQMMLERFGEEYAAYMRRTGRYWPKMRVGSRK